MKNFDLSINEGEKIAIIGKTGSGKSTIGQLLLRMYDITEGKIELDGKNIQSIGLHNLREQISYVPQDVFLFSDSVTSNIAFGMDGSDITKVKKAATQASVDKEIAGFSNEYDTLVGERGVTLSGGQKQRISIARALIKDPNLIIFDDCLSAVDSRTEKKIIESLNHYLKDKTAIIITHRIFSLLSFDKIVVLEKGTVAEQGTHQELLEKNGYYAKLFARQQELDAQAGE